MLVDSRFCDRCVIYRSLFRVLGLLQGYFGFDFPYVTVYEQPVEINRRLAVYGRSFPV